MLRRIIDSPWFYFTLAGLMLVGAVVSQIDTDGPARPDGTVNDFVALRTRDINVVFILIDTLRADRMSSYGYHRETSPVSDRLAATGVRFANVESQSSWTKSSMASLWTGMYPERTGILRFFHAMPQEAKLPAEILKEAGFRTAGLYRNGWVAPNFGFDQGFELYVRPTANRKPGAVRRRNPSAHALQGTDLDVTESALEFLHAFGDERFFLYLHLMDIHQYLYADVSPDFGTTFSDFYDSSIFWVDRNIGYVVDALEELDLMRETLIVIASDHGEGFFEHGEEGHARTLYSEVQDVPLIIVPPFQLDPGLVVETRVANVDIWPTLLDLLGMPPLSGAEGRSLMPLVYEAARALDGDAESAVVVTAAPAELETLQNRPLYSQLDRSWGRVGAASKPMVSVVEGSHRLIYRFGDPGRVELFDHSKDPLEKNDISSEEPELTARLRASVEGYLEKPRTEWKEVPEVELDEMRQGQLRALGYVIDQRRPPPQNPPPQN